MTADTLIRPFGAGFLLFLSFTTSVLSADLAKAQLEGQSLVKELLSRQPAEGMTNLAVLKIRDAMGRRTEIPVRHRIIVHADRWQSIYEAMPTNENRIRFEMTRTTAGTNQYRLSQSPGDSEAVKLDSDASLMAPFASSDFWLADLALDFFHWPGQRLLKKEMRRGESCNVLESVKLQAVAPAYSRVVSWIDLDTGGIVHAEAFDTGGKLLKIFEPKRFQKVNGKWEVKELEIRNEQTDSRTTLVFELQAK
jgi:hypothetical protein